MEGNDSPKKRERYSDIQKNEGKWKKEKWISFNRLSFWRLIQIGEKKDSEGKLWNEGEEKKGKERGTRVWQIFGEKKHTWVGNERL